jgi:hypothetical protein
MNALTEGFGYRVISQGLRPVHSPDLNPCNFYLWGALKDKVYMRIILIYYEN